MKILFGDASTGAINCFLKFLLFNRKRYSETEQISDPFRVNASKITTFENFDFKFAVISETVRVRAKRSEFWTLTGLLHAKLQILKFSICCLLIG